MALLPATPCMELTDAGMEVILPLRGPDKPVVADVDIEDDDKEEEDDDDEEALAAEEEEEDGEDRD